MKRVTRNSPSQIENPNKTSLFKSTTNSKHYKKQFQQYNEKVADFITNSPTLAKKDKTKPSEKDKSSSTQPEAAATKDMVKRPTMKRAASQPIQQEYDEANERARKRKGKVGSTINTLSKSKRKRAQTQKEEEQQQPDDEYEDEEGIVQTKKNFKYKSNLQGLIGFFTTEAPLNDDQRAYLRKHMPFMSLVDAIMDGKLSVKGTAKLDYQIKNIIEMFTEGSNTLDCNGQTFELNADDVVQTFGIIGGGEEIDATGQKKPDGIESFLKMLSPGKNLERLKGSVLRQALKIIINKANSKDNPFICQLITLYLMIVLFVPNTGSSLPWRYVKYVIDIDDIKTYDWAGHIYSILINSIKESPAEKVCGCVMLLPFWFLENVPIIQPSAPNEKLWCARWNLGELWNKDNMNKRTKHTYICQVVKKIQIEFTQKSEQGKQLVDYVNKQPLKVLTSKEGKKKKGKKNEGENLVENEDSRINDEGKLVIQTGEQNENQEGDKVVNIDDQTGKDMGQENEAEDDFVIPETSPDVDSGECGKLVKKLKAIETEGQADKETTAQLQSRLEQEIARASKLESENRQKDVVIMELQRSKAIKTEGGVGKATIGQLQSKLEQEMARTTKLKEENKQKDVTIRELERRISNLQKKLDEEQDTRNLMEKTDQRKTLDIMQLERQIGELKYEVHKLKSVEPETNETGNAGKRKASQIEVPSASNLKDRRKIPIYKPISRATYLDEQVH